MSTKEKFLASAQKHLEKGQLQKAIADYQQLVELDRRDARHRLKLADLLCNAKRNADAVEHYEAVAKLYMESGFADKASALYKKVQKLDPERIEPCLRLAELNVKQGRAGNALSEYRTLVVLYEKKGLLGDAAPILLKMADLEPDSPALRVRAIEHYVRAGMKKEGLVEAEKLVAALEARGQLEPLAKIYERFLALFQDSLPLQIGFARMLAQRGDVEKGLQLLKGLLRQNPDDAELLDSLALAYRAGGDYENERLTLQHMLKKKPEHPVLRERMVNACLDGGEPERALAALSEWGLEFLGRGHATLDAWRETFERVLPGDARIAEIFAPAASTVEPEAVPAPVPAQSAAPAPESEVAPPAPSPNKAASAPVVAARQFSAEEEGAEEISLDFLAGMTGLTLEPVLEPPLVAEELHPAVSELDLGAAAEPGLELELELDLDLDLGSPSDSFVEFAASDLEKELDAPSIQPSRDEIHAPSSVDAETSAFDADAGEFSLELGSASFPDPAATEEFGALDLSGVESVSLVEEGGTPAELELPGSDFVLSGTSDAEQSEIPPDELGVDLAVPEIELDRGGFGMLDLETPLEEPGIAEAVPVEPPPVLAGHDSGVALDEFEDLEELEELEELVELDESEDEALTLSSAAVIETDGHFAETNFDPGVESISVQPVGGTDESALLAATLDAAGIGEPDAPIEAPVSQPELPTGELDANAEVALLSSSDLDTSTLAVTSGQDADLSGLDLGDSQLDESAATSLAAELEEAEFYLHQGLFTDAERVCRHVLEQSPENPAALARLAEVDARRAETQVSAEPAGDFFDLASEILDDGAFKATEDLPGLEDLDRFRFDGVFSEFKKGIESQIDVEDTESHYNLGIAYKEMGLLDDAIAEFEKAMKSPVRLVDSMTLKGICLAEKGTFEQAEQVFLAGIDNPTVSTPERTSLYYEMGLLYEVWGRPEDALQSFTRVAESDHFFRDVAEKLQQLRAKAGVVEPGNAGPGGKGGRNRVSYV